jgi:diphthamide synthase (EF-2-diphthine--ammonia ligase)
MVFAGRQGRRHGSVHPLWQRSRQELLREFIDLGFKP